MAHAAIGRLRGRAEPRQDILDRLLEIHPAFRVYWSPESHGPGYDEDGKLRVKPGFWEIHQYSPSPLRKEAGHAMLARLRALFDRKSESAKEQLNLGTIEYAEQMIDQVHYVWAVPEAMFGQDMMFEELRDIVAQTRRVQQEMEAELKRAEARQVMQEGEDNPAFDEQMKLLWADEYERICLDAKSVGYTPPPKPAAKRPLVELLQ